MISMTPGTVVRSLACFALLFSSTELFAQKQKPAQTPKPTAQTQTPGMPRGDSAASAASAKMNAAYGKLPLSFEPNKGQTDPAVSFLARTPNAEVFLSGSDAVLVTQAFAKDAHQVTHLSASSSLRMHLDGAAKTPAVTPESTLPGTVSYMHGNDHSKWQTALPTYSGVRLSSVYPGVDLRYYGTAGQLEYDFLLAPDADPKTVRLQFQGTSARLADNGDLVLPSAVARELRFDKPVAYQNVAGKRVPVEVRFHLDADRIVTFDLGAYDHTRQLVIDPKLVYLGTLGTGLESNDSSQIVVDSAGALYFIGTTFDPTFPVTAGAYQTVCGPTAGNRGQGSVYCPTGNPYGQESAAYITKLSADGTQLIYSTYLSGHSGTESGSSIAVDSAGIAYLLGATASNDFPVTADAFQKICQPAQPPGFEPAPVLPTAQCDNYANGGGTEYTINGPVLFFAKLSASGSSLIYSSFLGGTLPVYPGGTALDASGNWYLTGQGSALQPNDIYGAGGGNVQYPGITSSGYQQYSTEFNNPSSKSASRADVGFVLSKFSNDGHTLLYGTFLNDPQYDTPYYPQSFAVGANGYVFLGGTTQSALLQTTAGAVKTSCTVVDPNSSGTTCTTVDGFIAAFDTTKAGAASLVYATRLGGTDTAQGSNTQQQQVIGLAADIATNNIYATGYTFDHGFPIPKNGYQSTCPNYDATKSTYDYCSSAYVIELNSTGTAILGGSFLVGPNFRSAGSTGYNVRLDSKKQVYLYGISNDGGGDFPQVNPLQSYKGGNQLFISTFSADMSKLLFSTRFGNPSFSDHSVAPAGGMVLDPSDNIYFAGTTSDTTFAGTTGTYSTANNGGNRHTFFAKLSKVLQPDTTTLTITPATVGQGNPVTYKAVVAGTLQTTPAPTGTVTFSATNTTPATVLGTATLDATGTATLSAAAPVAGTYTLIATYNADTVYDYSTSSSATLTVNTTTGTTTTLTASPATARSGAPVTLTATVAGAGGTPTGTVTFFDGTTALSTTSLTTGSAVYTTTALSAASHSITARYSGDNSFAASTSAAQTVAVSLNTVTLALTATPALSPVGGTVTLTATLSGATSSTAPTGKITFYNGTTALGTATVANNAASLTTTTLPAGTASLTAMYSGDTLYSTVVSSSQSVVVRAPAATTTTLSSSAASVTAGTSITFTATVSSTTTTGSPSGTVTFMDGSTSLGMGTVSSGVATFVTGTLAVGAHTITAVYSGDSLFLASTSAAFTQTVIVAAIALTTPSTSITVSRGQSVMAVISATPNGNYTGTLNFACGTLPAYASCTFAPASLAFTGTSTLQTTTLTFNTKSATSALLHREDHGQSTVITLMASLFFPAGFVALGLRRRTRGLRTLGLMTLLVAMSLGAVGLSGCAASSSTPTTAVGTYTVPVTATVNGTATTLNLNITVQ